MLSAIGIGPLRCGSLSQLYRQAVLTPSAGPSDGLDQGHDDEDREHGHDGETDETGIAEEERCQPAQHDEDRGQRQPTRGAGRLDLGLVRAGGLGGDADFCLQLGDLVLQAVGTRHGAAQPR